MHLYFIRHGQSTNNALWAQNGSRRERTEDPELTEVGERQAALLARFLARDAARHKVPVYNPKDIGGFDITHLYCSPMIRAISTAMYIAQALDLQPTVWRDVHEVGGIFLEDLESGEAVGLPGRSRAYFRERYPELILSDELGTDGWWDRPFEGRVERRGRAERVLQQLVERHGGTDNRIALVSHAGFYNYLMGAVLRLPQRDDAFFVMDNAAITRLQFEEDRTLVVYTNRTEFLPDGLIT
jgi:2,3-bisphosphoglycerate-dependent phosphoglycerate mutase